MNTFNTRLVRTSVKNKSLSCDDAMKLASQTEDIDLFLLLTKYMYEEYYDKVIKYTNDIVKRINDG